MRGALLTIRTFKLELSPPRGAALIKCYFQTGALVYEWGHFWSALMPDGAAGKGWGRMGRLGIQIGALSAPGGHSLKVLSSNWSSRLSVGPRSQITFSKPARPPPREAALEKRLCSNWRSRLCVGACLGICFSKTGALGASGDRSWRVYFSNGRSRLCVSPKTQKAPRW